MLVKAVNLNDAKEAPRIHGWRQLEAVSGVDRSLSCVTHGMAVSGSVRLQRSLACAYPWRCEMNAVEFRGHCLAEHLVVVIGEVFQNLR